MKNQLTIRISRWANQHKTKARILLIIAHITWISIAFVIGISLYAFDISFPGATGIIALLGFATSYLSYPDLCRPERITRQAYRRKVQKDIVMTMCAFVILLTGIPKMLDYETVEQNKTMPVRWMVAGNVKQDVKTMDNREQKILTGKFDQVKKQWLRKIKKHDTGESEKVKASQIMLALLMVLLAVGAFYMVGALACNISCAGNEALAVVVFFGGVAGILTGLITGLVSIFRKKPKMKRNIKSSL